MRRSIGLGSISGAQAAITAGSLHTLTQLFDLIDTAPYWGAFFPTTGLAGANVFSVTNVTSGASPTVTAPSHNFTNGQTVAMFVTGGTVGSVLNSNASPGTNVYAIVSGVSGNNFAINVTTSGSCNSSTCSGYVMDSQYPKLADRSVTLNGSTPATYPTKFSFFAQQLNKALINGSATDASYGTISYPVYQSFSGGAGSIQDYLGQQALLANQVGLQMGQYEGGFGKTLTGVLTSIVPQQFMEFSNQSQFDSGVAGDTSCGGAACNTANTYAVNFAAQRAVKSPYPSQFNEIQPQTESGPWGALRFTPGDSGNPRWSATLAENALGVYVDPIAPATGTYAYAGNSTNRAFFNSACSSCTDSFTPTIGTAATKVIVGVTVSVSSPTITSVVCDGVTMTTPDSKSQSGSGRSVSIYSGAMSAGAS